MLVQRGGVYHSHLLVSVSHHVTGCNQHASSSMVLSSSRRMQIINRLILLHSRWGFLYMLGQHQFLHPWVTALALPFITCVAVHCQLLMGRWLISFLHRVKIVCHVMTSGLSRTAVPCFHTNLPCFFHSSRLAQYFGSFLDPS